MSNATLIDPSSSDPKENILTSGPRTVSTVPDFYASPPPGSISGPTVPDVFLDRLISGTHRPDSAGDS